MSFQNGGSWLRPFLAGIFTTLAATQLRRLFLLQFKLSGGGGGGGGDGDDGVRANEQRCVVSQPGTEDRKQNKDDDEKEDGATPNATTESPTEPTADPSVLMDSPKLDQRILRKAEAALLNRTSRLIIVVERCTNDHNYSAILRTAEALGVQHVYIIAPQCINKTLHSAPKEDAADLTAEENGAAPETTLHRSTGQKVRHATQSEVQDRALHHLFAQRALEWLTVREFPTTKECIDTLKSDGYEIWSTDLSQTAECLTPQDLSLPPSPGATGGHTLPPLLAIVFGTEAVGCTTEILSASHRRVYLPLRGYADSLNLSVATALIVQRLFDIDPTLVGGMPDADRAELRSRWYAKLAGQRLETKSQKADRRRLDLVIRAGERLEVRRDAYLADPTCGTALTAEQVEKVERLPELRKQREESVLRLAKDAARAVEASVKDPPLPLGDMRRADEHRVTYAGKRTKVRHAEAWKGMPATEYYRTGEGDGGGSAEFFRGCLRDAEGGE